MEKVAKERIVDHSVLFQYLRFSHRNNEAPDYGIMGRVGDEQVLPHEMIHV